MSPQRRGWYLTLLVALVVVFVFLPAVCASTDHHHEQGAAHCPFCTFVLAYSGVLACTAWVFGIILSFLSVLHLAGAAASPAADLLSLPPIRGPPSFATGS